jgi:hypothetical protein
MMWVYDERKITGLISRMPITKWSNCSKRIIKLSTTGKMSFVNIDERKNSIKSINIKDK